GLKGKLRLTCGDAARLERPIFLNDILIELGLRLFLDDLRKANPELAKQILVVNSFFFTKLAKEGHAGVKKWTKNVQLSEKKWILLPINQDKHWYLAIIYLYPRNTILVLDSLGQRHDDVVQVLTEYLKKETRLHPPHEKHTVPIRRHVPVPRQLNAVDCGLFLLHFAQLFM
ncbi:hypothetical protein C8R44DRAFT_545556, partial [Mycena epipterygia]